MRDLALGTDFRVRGLQYGDALENTAAGSSAKMAREELNFDLPGSDPLSCGNDGCAASGAVSAPFVQEFTAIPYVQAFTTGFRVGDSLRVCPW